ncbi:MAG: hypothetical protein K1W38_20900 [Lachnospiraceae bacterium]|jgi:hypothetical protein
MLKKDLKSGMVVRTNNNIYYMVLIDTGMETSEYSDKDVLLAIDRKGNIGHDGWMSLFAYNEKLECEHNEWSIAEVFSVRCAADIGRIVRYRSIWKRQDN